MFDPDKIHQERREFESALRIHLERVRAAAAFLDRAQYQHVRERSVRQELTRSVALLDASAAKLLSFAHHMDDA